MLTYASFAVAFVVPVYYIIAAGALPIAVVGRTPSGVRRAAMIQP